MRFHVLMPKPVEMRWECPNCDLTAVTRRLPGPGYNLAEMHNCAGLAGLWSPMVPAGTRCKVEALERQDYLGADAGRVRLDGEGRPIMAAVTTRDEGQDCAVYAPVANGGTS